MAEASMAIGAIVQSAKRQNRTIFQIEPRILRAIAQLAECDCPILIVGEVGVGKRSVAELIYAQSQRSRGAFREIRAAECNPDLMRLALSSRGTIYLSEIAELSPSVQALIVENYICAKRPPNGRLLCGTSRELLDEVKSRRLRDDFFHVISAVTLRIPPLRHRRSELLTIAELLMAQYARQFDRPKPILSPEISSFLLHHNWPGNLHELQTAMKTLVAIEDQAISLAAIKAASPIIKAAGPSKTFSLKEASRAASIQVEQQLISEVLVATGGNRKRAASELGISYKALLYKLKLVDSTSQPSSHGDGVGL